MSLSRPGKNVSLKTYCVSSTFMWILFFLLFKVLSSSVKWVSPHFLQTRALDLRDIECLAPGLWQSSDPNPGPITPPAVQKQCVVFAMSCAEVCNIYEPTQSSLSKLKVYVLTLPMCKSKLGEVKPLARSHTAYLWQSWNLKSGLSDSKCFFHSPTAGIRLPLFISFMGQKLHRERSVRNSLCP